MGPLVNFDYFYGNESEQFSYYRIPRLLVTGAQFKSLSTDAKLLYGLMLDRMGLSAKHGWYDDLGRVFIYYPLEEIQDALNCAHGKAVKLLAELDTNTGLGLIERVKQGQGRPARIYVKQFTTKAVPSPPETGDSRLPKIGSQDFSKAEVQTSEKQNPRLPNLRSADFSNSEVFLYRKSYPDPSYLNPSIHPSNQEMNGMDRASVEACVKENIGYIAFTGRNRQLADELAALITDVLCSSQASFRIGGSQINGQLVRERFAELQQPHIEYVLDCLEKNTTRIRNIRSYLLTTLYNAPTTMAQYYQAAVQHDLYGQHSGP